MRPCRICGGRSLETFLSLGDQPHCNRFLRADQLRDPEPAWPLDLCFCPDCALVQLGTTVDREIMFLDHPYVSGTTRTLPEHFRALAADIARRYSLGPDSLVVDVGSNDGTFLQGFRKLGARTLGVEPARKIAEIARAGGIETVEAFFGRDSAARIVASHGRARTITAAGVFFHIDDLDDFLDGVTELLEEDGVFIVQAMYLVDILDRTAFDAVYHEHLEYYSLHPLVKLFGRHGLEIVDVARKDIHGGSFILHAVREGRATASVREILALERGRGILSIATYREFAARVARIRTDLVGLLRRLKGEGKRIAAYGAPARGNTLLNYCGIGPDLIDYAAEKNDLKVGLYTPGMRIPVRHESEARADPPDCFLVLAWNFFDEFLKKEEEFVRGGGRFILPVPEPRIVP
ncbi:MAG: class I SAM-dependent methyltransferase [Planctomycetes bacterium]|nr:class I SAM-dependent methyltransferase [Planctomycetota bacterium]